MKVSSWGWGRLLKLPDWCFGRRWIITTEAYNSGLGLAWNISELGLPERSVVWQVQAVISQGMTASGNMRLALGDQLPANAAAMNRLEELIPGMGNEVMTPRAIYASGFCVLFDLKTRYGLEASGRRVVVEYHSLTATPSAARLSMVVSGVPSEVPDWVV